MLQLKIDGNYLQYSLKLFPIGENPKTMCKFYLTIEINKEVRFSLLSNNSFYFAIGLISSNISS